MEHAGQAISSSANNDMELPKDDTPKSENLERDKEGGVKDTEISNVDATDEAKVCSKDVANKLKIR